MKRIVFVSMLILLLVLIAATILEKVYGSGFVSLYIYNSVPFVALWGIAAISGLAYVLTKRLHKRLFTFLLHLSFVLILAGAFTSWLSGVQGELHLRKNEKTSVFVDKKGNNRHFPFQVTLREFRIIDYPGTTTPMNFISQISIETQEKESCGEASMNKVFSYHGYRFYQAGYDNDGEGSKLSIAHDPIGISVTYSGYAFLLLSFILFFLDKKSQFRLLINSPLLRKSAITGVLFVLSFSHVQAAQPKVLPEKIAECFGDLYVLYNGRICPLQTLAKDFTVKLYGKPTYMGYTAEQIFTGWMFYFTSWKEQPMIEIKSKATRHLLGLESKYATFDDFFDTEKTYKLASVKTKIQSGEKVNDMRGIEEADEKLNIISMFYSGKMFCIFPYRNSNAKVQWFAPVDNLPEGMESNQWFFIRKSLDYAFELVVTKDYKNVTTLLEKIKKYQKKEAGDVLPSDTKFKAEKIYNQISYTSLLAIFLIVTGLLSFVYDVRKMIFQQVKNRAWIIIQNTILVFAFFYLSATIILRGYVSNHLPLSNGFETMQFMAWCSLLLTFLIQKKFSMALPFGTIISGLALMVAFMGESNPQITPLMPVLASPLLSIHVVVIMLAYSLLAFVMLNGVTALVLNASKQNCSLQIERLAVISRIMLYPAVFLLTIGIFVGAVWANVAWGRYWGWDPKEVWALITMLIYAATLHSGLIPWLRHPVIFHLFSIISFITVLITYFGVNFILGGMHGYAG